MNPAAFIIGVLAVAIIGFAVYLFLKKKKSTPKVEETSGFAEMQTKVAKLKTKGKVEDRDFVTAILSIEELNRKTAEEVDNWIQGKVGEEGTLSDYEATGLGLQELTYTDTDGKVYDVFFLIVDHTDQDVIDWKPMPIPEPKPEPKGRDIIEVPLQGGGVDNTAMLREPFNKDNVTYELPKDGKGFALGILETDTIYREGIRIGEHAIIRLQNRKNIEIDGQNATLWNDRPAVPDSYPEGHEKYGQKYPRNSGTMSKRKFFRVNDSEMVWLHDINVESGNLVPDDKPNRPDYNPLYEFEHGVDVNGSKKVAIENFYARGLWGDGTYIIDSYDVYMRNVTIDWNGRQGGAMISGGRAYLERYNVLNSRRSSYDIEGNVGNNDSDGFVITYSKFRQHLLGLPMGGPGFVKNVLSINNFYQNGTIFCEGNETGRKRRENIMFVRNKARNVGDYFYTDNILIDGIEQDGIKNNNLILGRFFGSSNVTIRNCNLPSYGNVWKGSEPFFLVGASKMDISEFKIYNNTQKIGILLHDTEVRADKIEIGKWYYKTKDDDNTNFVNLDPVTNKYFEIFKPTRQATVKDFLYVAEFETMEEAAKAELIDEEVYKIGDDFYQYESDSEEGEALWLMTVEDLDLVNPIEFPKEYVPTPEEAVSIPFKTDNPWVDFQWERLYTNGHGWREEDYKDDGWRPDWLLEMYRNKKQK